jgi:hypothetical protein
MNKNEIKNIILEEIKAAINEQTEDARIAQAMETGDEDELESLAMGALDRAEQLAADSRPEEDDFAFDKMDGEMYDDGGDPMEEMARTSNIFKLKDGAGLKDVLQFMQRVNDVLKTYKSPGQKRPKKRFTPEEMKALAKAMLKPEGFTSKDVIASTSYTSPAQANKFLAALEQKGLITITSILKKSLVPDRDPNAPETRGRKAQSAEFDMSDDPLDMDFGDFDDLDLSDPTALYELSEGRFGNVIQSLTQDISKAQDEGDNKMVSILKSYLPKLKRTQDDDEIESLLNDMDTQLAREFGERFDIVSSYLAEGRLYLSENASLDVNVNEEEDEVEVTYKGESYKSALGDELLFIHYFEDDEYHSENDAPEIFKYLKGKGGELEVDDDEATLTIKMSDLAEGRLYLSENASLDVNVNEEEDEVEVTYKGESYKSALGDELLFIHYFEDDEYHSENDAPEIFKYLKGKGGELEVDDDEATLTIKMSDLAEGKLLKENTITGEYER